jgi:hypothetical protein
MIVRFIVGLFVISILLIDTLNAINPAYFRQHQKEEELASLIDSITKQLDDQHSNFDSSEKYLNNDNNEDDDQLIKRNKYPNFHVSPLWLSRRTRTNRFYGKPLWISRTG